MGSTLRYNMNLVITIQPSALCSLYHFVCLIYAVLTHIFIFVTVQNWQRYSMSAKCWVSICHLNTQYTRVTCGFYKTHTCTLENPHLWTWVRVFMGTGAGFPGKPQGSLWHSLAAAPNLVIPTTDKNGNRCFKSAFNTQACEQLNSWLGGYEYILKCMTPGNFNWFLHSML